MSMLFRQSVGALRLNARAPLSALSSGSSTAASSSLFRLTASRFITTEARKKIDDVVKSNPLVVFMKGTPDMPMCGFSRAVVQIMQVQGVKPEKLKTFNCLEDQELRESIKEYSDWPTIPQVYVDGEFVGGCDIMINMHQSGELEELLLKHDLLLPLEENKTAPSA
ncbi:glutaredoxin [Testicularia cyperi]|uniref:Monothiol glutaredoxin-5, mitochondrial n=1 Tax=Testicularia cyperi TaxID=1882483 RepID=A0A317XNW5_9BASI|nr:glutaredoxin [Testicularia cyperi]